MLQKPDPNSPGVHQGDGDEIDLRAYWRVLMRRRWVALSVLAAVVLVTLVVTLRQTKIYAATATLIIDVAAPKILNNKDVQEVVESGSGGYWSNKEYFETQYKVIASRAVAQRVVEKLQLQHDLRFLDLEGVRDEAKLKRALSRVDPVTELQERLMVIPVKDSRVVRIQIEDRDPKWAATIANAVAEAYMTETLSVRSSTTQSASEWLEGQLADLEAKLGKSADALFAFKRAHDIVATSWEDRQSIVTQRLVAINDALTKARVQKAQVAARNEQIEKAVAALAADPQADASVLVGQNMAIPELKVRYLDAKVECADLGARYLPNHPKAESCAAKVATAKQSLDREVKSTLSAAKREYAEAVETEHKLQRLLDETKTDAFGVNQYEKEYLELKRANDNNQRLYEMVLGRLKDTGVTGMLQASNVRILDRAEPPDAPVTPKPLRNLAVAVLLGLIGGVGLAFLLEYLDTTITTREQIEEHLGLPFLGIIPELGPSTAQGRRELLVHSAPRSPAAECVRSIRTNLLFMSPEKPLRTILVTSSGPGEGKTTTAAALAEAMADGGSRVLLLDADMRRPRMHEVFGLSKGSGLSSLIVGEGKLGELVRTSEVPNLSVLPCGPVPPNPAELLHTAAFAALLHEAMERFDRVIIDSPPAGVVSDAIVISTQVDGVLMVLKAGLTSRDAAARTTRALAAVNARVFGAVLNELDLEDQRYGGYYQYYRYGYYGSQAKEKTSAEVA